MGKDIKVQLGDGLTFGIRDARTIPTPVPTPEPEAKSASSTSGEKHWHFEWEGDAIDAETLARYLEIAAQSIKGGNTQGDGFLFTWQLNQTQENGA